LLQPLQRRFIVPSHILPADPPISRFIHPHRVELSLLLSGNDALAVHTAAATLVAQVRAGQGPLLLHAMTYRVKGHVSVDPAAYRDPQELAAALLTDPIARLRERFQALGFDLRELDALDNAATAEVQAALDAASAAPWPEAEAAYTDVQTTGAGTWF
jgi:pyruvate dehydrogenase E1 component alpha subunit